MVPLAGGGEGGNLKLTVVRRNRAGDIRLFQLHLAEQGVFAAFLRPWSKADWGAKSPVKRRCRATYCDPQATYVALEAECVALS